MRTQEEAQRAYYQSLIDEEKRELEENSELINNFKKECLGKGVNLLDSNFSYVRKIGLVAKYPNILSYLAPTVIKDKEGLNDFKYLNTRFSQRPYAKGFLYSDNFMVMAHPYFRRGLDADSTFAPRFIELFWSFNEPKIESFLALDYDRVRINVDNSMYMEKDTWYGPQFNSDIKSIPNEIVKLRPPSDIDSFLISFCFSDAYSLDIKWETKNGIKSFQVEEFKTEDNAILRKGLKVHPVRYVHAEFDLALNHFRHFDGAVHFYSDDEYLLRRDSDFNYNSKNDFKIKTDSEKLFKMNGIISVPSWIEFTSQFLTGNPLIFEYFEGRYPEPVEDILSAIRKKKIDNQNGS